MKMIKMFVLTLVFAAVAQAAVDPLIGITPVTRSFPQEGGNAAINTSGSGTWTATKSDSWITLTSSSGSAGTPVAYLVAANDGVENRVGYVYVSGHSHEITQAGIGANLNSISADFEYNGGNGSVAVSAPVGKTWHARSNVDWITVATSTGTGAQSVTYTVSQYNEVSTRSGTLTIADNTFTVNQTGRRMKLKENSVTTDYLAEVLKIRITALASTMWEASSNAAWAMIVDGSSGQGGGTVSVQISENESYNERNAVITVGTESYAIKQLGRTSLVFKIDSTEKKVASDGLSSERVAVTATMDLGWSGSSNVDWIELATGYKSGSGNGSLVYSVKPNPTLYARSGVVTVTAADSHVAAKKIEINQEAAVAMLTFDGYQFEAVQESVNVGVTVPAIVGWNVINVPSWLSVSGLSMVGPAELTLTASANTSVKPRSAVLRIADHNFTVSQKGRGVGVNYSAKVFDTDGKSTGADSDNVITVTAESDVHWTADASDTWIVIYEGKSGTGNGTVKYIVAPYVGSGDVRTGTITIGDQVVYITQRPYELSINPMGNWVDGNSGAGEIQVALDIDGVWNAIASEPWVTIVQGYDAGTGSGRVLFHYTDNNTGKERSAKIVIAGEVYTLIQQARQNIVIGAEVDGHGGTVSGGGTYNIGTSVTLTAVPESGYVFSYWTIPGAGTSTDASIDVTATAAKSYVATFTPIVPQLAVADASLQGVRLVWTNLAWATQYYIWRGTTSNRGAATKIDTLDNDGTHDYLDSTGTENQYYWYWVEAVGVEDDVWSSGVQARREKKSFNIVYKNLRGTSQANPATYLEGSTVNFSAPSARTGYTFLGWVPSSITPQTSGDVEVRATWLQNSYTVRFNANGGTSDMQDEDYTYGYYRYLNETNITRNGFVFQGWSTTQNGAVEYMDKESVKNLSAQLNHIVTLYAVWNALIGIEDDSEAVVSGNETDGYVIKPSDSKTEVVARIPTGFDPSKVVLELSPEVESVLPKGATIKIVKNGNDITGFLNIPAVDGAGCIDLTKAEVKDEIVKETLDPSKGAVIELTSDNPQLTTPNTRPGLTYTLREGTTLEGMAPGASKLGDGTPWTPTITIKGGTSGFYSIEVTK